jgi:[ribosomal protein S18]-alanine N-acetyltransferase
MSDPVRLVPVGQSHAAVLAALQAQCFEDVWSQASMAEIVSSPGAFAWLALAAPDLPVGFALARLAADEAEVLSLGVLTECRQRGIARMLLKAVIDHAAVSGARSVFLEVAESNDPARLLYAAFGFSAVGRRPDYYRRPNAVPIAALTLRLELAR